MFRIQNWTQALGLMALGSLFTIIGMLLSPVSAQRDKFEEIECTTLRVVDTEGNPVVILDGIWGVTVYDKGSNNVAASISSDHMGGRVAVFGTRLDGNRESSRNARGSASISIGAVGGRVDVYGDALDIYGAQRAKAGIGINPAGGAFASYNSENQRVVWLGGVEHGGKVEVFNNDHNLGVSLRIGEHGGAVIAHGKDGKSAATLGIHEHGGHVQVKGKGEGKAVMGVNEYGNGGVSAWDKNGYRQ